MTATAEAPAEQTAEDQQAANAAPSETPKVVVKKEPHPCLCQQYEVVGESADEVYAPECEQTTQSVFAQGHDARLVSFLVSAYFDGYKLRRVIDGKGQSFATPADAVAGVSEPLRLKAEKATENRQGKINAAAERNAAKEKAKAERAAAKEKAKAEKEAAKAAAPKATGAEVVAGTAEGDPIARPEGTTRIKVGRFEYDAVIDDAGTATYTDGKGDTQTRERDGYRVLDEQA